MVRCITVPRLGGPERLTVVEVPRPEPALGEVRVRALAAGVSYPDLLMREGTYPEGPTPPFTPGYDLRPRRRGWLRHSSPRQGPSPLSEQSVTSYM